MVSETTGEARCAVCIADILPQLLVNILSWKKTPTQRNRSGYLCEVVIFVIARRVFSLSFVRGRGRTSLALSRTSFGLRFIVVICCFKIYVNYLRVKIYFLGWIFRLVSWLEFVCSTDQDLAWVCVYLYVFLCTVLVRTKLPKDRMMIKNKKKSPEWGQSSLLPGASLGLGPEFRIKIMYRIRCRVGLGLKHSGHFPTWGL